MAVSAFVFWRAIIRTLSRKSYSMGFVVIARSVHRWWKVVIGSTKQRIDQERMIREHLKMLNCKA